MEPLNPKHPEHEPPEHEHPAANGTTDADEPAGDQAGKSRRDPEDPATLTAIERQRLALAAIAAENRRAAGAGKKGSGKPRNDRQSQLAWIAIVVLVAVGLAVLYAVIGLPLRDFGDLSGSISPSSGPAPVRQQSAKPASSENTPASTPAAQTRPVEPQPVASRPADTKLVGTKPVETKPVETRPQSADSVNANPVRQGSESASSSDTVAVPVSDLKLQDEPELFRQLVQVYRKKLADDPNDIKAVNALRQLQQRSLAELKAAVEQGKRPVAERLTGAIAMLFPELADNPEYQSLQQQLGRAASKPQPAAEKPVATRAAVAKTAATDRDNASAHRPSPLRPEIVSLSITPGVMVDGQFVPKNDGGILMVHLGYRNFSYRPADQGNNTLVLQLGVPGNSMLLAEVPVTLYGDRGIKNIPVKTLMDGNTGGPYRVEFILHDKLLTARTVALTMPGN